MDTNGAAGAARASGVAIGCFANLSEAMQTQQVVKAFHPSPHPEAYHNAYQQWEKTLRSRLETIWVLPLKTKLK